MKIAVFGGTFNPPHKGHILLLRQVMEQCGLDRAIVIPTNIPPHKVEKNHVKAEYRVKMLSLCDWGLPVEISDIELKRPGKSYTVDTFEQLHIMYPKDDFYFVMGSDMLLTFQQWHKWQQLLGLATFCVAARCDQDISKIEEKAACLSSLGGKFITIKYSPLEVSSTYLRQCIADNISVAQWMDQAVIDYIKGMRLYQNDN